MIDAIRSFGQSGAILLLGLSIGAAWIVAIVSPNTSYDNLSESKADHHVRELLKTASDPIAVLLLVAGGLAILGGSLVSGLAAIIAACGFFSNRWTLSGNTKKDSESSHDEVGKTRRILAVSLTLVFGIVALVSAIFAVLNR